MPTGFRQDCNWKSGNIVMYSLVLNELSMMTFLEISSWAEIMNEVPERRFHPR